MRDHFSRTFQSGRTNSYEKCGPKAMVRYVLVSRGRCSSKSMCLVNVLFSKFFIFQIFYFLNFYVSVYSLEQQCRLVQQVIYDDCLPFHPLSAVGKVGESSTVQPAWVIALLKVTRPHWTIACEGDSLVQRLSRCAICPPPFPLLCDKHHAIVELITIEAVILPVPRKSNTV